MGDPKLTDVQFLELLKLMMCCDPWPVVPMSVVNQRVMEGLADQEARARGFSDWIHAYMSNNSGGS